MLTEKPNIVAKDLKDLAGQVEKHLYKIYTDLTERNIGRMNLSELPTHADNNAAKTGGLKIGDLYKNTTGSVYVVH